MRTPIELRVVQSLAGIPPAAWNALVDGHPMQRYEFLHALHETGCANGEAGWLPQYLTAWRQGSLVGAMPLYLKSHSYGEYVFDWAWADAYYRNGLEYYPKLLAAIPFSPVSAAKVLTREAAVRDALIDGALQAASGFSSLHILFPGEDELARMQARGMLVRRGVQFHWINQDYRSFDDFLAHFSHDKRKRIKQERRRVREAGITFRRLVGREITAAHWAFFNRCYRGTYRAHRSSPYLNLAFFQTLGEQLGEHVMFVLAERDGQPLASALNIFTSDRLYGRYWGTMEFASGLHFEACYYQAIEFCIERGIAIFEGGAQGEHKLARGFTPVERRSAHWLKHPQFARAVGRFLDEESEGIAHYIDELEEHSPYKSAPAGEP